MTHLDFPTIAQGYSTDTNITLEFDLSVRNYAKLLILSIVEATNQITYEITTYSGVTLNGLIKEDEVEENVVNDRIKKIVITNTSGQTVRYRVGRTQE